MTNIGKDSIGLTNPDTLPADYIEVFGPYAPLTSGSLTSLSMYTNVAGVTFKLLIYGDTAGAPGALLGKTGDMTSVTNNWVTANTLAAVALTSGNNYYIGNMQSTLISSRSDAGNYGWYKNGQTYGTEPNPFPAGYATETNLKSIYGTYTPDTGGGPSIFPQFGPMI